MNRIGTSTNLGRNGTYDILLTTFPDSFPEGRVVFEIGPVPRKITGVQKVAQTFLKSLLTTKGSDPLRPRYGTMFNLDIAGSNQSTNLQDLHTLVATILADAEAQTKAIMNRANIDLASQLKSITLITLKREGEMLTIYVSVQTKDGQTAQIAVPFPQMDLRLTSNG